MPKRVHIVPHTHWDREWYLTRQRFSLLLVQVVDRLIDILNSEHDFPPFLFDGQTIALEDYLELRPEAEEKMQELIGTGRVLIGPWYVLPDEVLISGEAHIRNYLEGMRVAREFGGGMAAGYLPDSFGHPSQMPQILSGLGLEEIVFWRGLGPEVETTEFEWTGFDGTTILGINMPLGYGVGAALPDEPDELAARIKKRCGELAPRTITNSLLLMNGVDHLAPEHDLPSRIDAIAGETPYELRLSTLPAYLAEVKSQLGGVELPKAAGELRSGFRAYLLGGTLSTRIYLKQLNARVESLLETELEPLLSAASLLGVYRYSAGIMRRLWREALSNLPHDSICGCSIDEVHAQMETRYRDIVEGGEALRDEVLAAVAGAVPNEGAGSDRVIVFNPHPFATSASVEMEIDVGLTVARRVDHNDALLVEYRDDPPSPPVQVFLRPVDGSAAGAAANDAAGATVVAEILDCSEVETLRTSLDDQPVMYRANRLAVRFAAVELPPCGYRVYEVRTGAAVPETERRAEGSLSIENDFVRVTADERGAFSLLDKRSGAEMPELFRLEDSGDAGDEYTYCSPAVDSTVVFGPAERIRRVDEVTLEVGGIALIPEGVTPDRQRRSAGTVECPYRAAVRLQPSGPRLDITIDFTNKADNHILKIVFPTGLQTDRSLSGGTFCVDEREYRDPGGEEFADWVERPSGTYPQKGFATVTDGRQAITVMSRGLPEYALRPRDERASPGAPRGATIAVTLLRCVGQLSRVDLPCRPGNAGWPLETPGAQCHGSHRFELALLVHAAEDSAKVPNMAKVFATPPFASQALPPAVVHAEQHPARETERPAAALATEVSLLSIDNPRIVMSALKQRERGDGVVIRLVNPHPEPASGRLTLAPVIADQVTAVFRSNLAEVEEAPVEFHDTTIDVELRGGEILTLCLRL